MFRPQPLCCEGTPGTGFSCNDANSHILGAIIERLTGQHWDEMLDTATCRAMTTPAVRGESGSGMGTMIGTFDGHRTMFHPGGAGSGARSVVAYFPDDSLAIVLLANAEPVDLDRVEAAITAGWYGAGQPSGSH